MPLLKLKLALAAGRIQAVCCESIVLWRLANIR